jgi:hypothetical protein
MRAAGDVTGGEQPWQARAPVLVDDDTVVHHHASRCRQLGLWPDADTDDDGGRRDRLPISQLDRLHHPAGSVQRRDSGGQ